jgi:phosphatidylglycerophosphatase C
VSGAFDVYLEHECRRHSAELICSHLEIADVYLTGRYRDAACRYEESRRVREACVLENFAHVYAGGETNR